MKGKYEPAPQNVSHFAGDMTGKGFQYESQELNLTFEPIFWVFHGIRIKPRYSQNWC
jgi:hypothetical protein